MVYMVWKMCASGESQYGGIALFHDVLVKMWWGVQVTPQRGSAHVSTWGRSQKPQIPSRHVHPIECIGYENEVGALWRKAKNGQLLGSYRFA